MPQIIVRYKKDAQEEVTKLGYLVSALVAEAISTNEHPLSVTNIEWIPQQLEAGAIAPKLRLEIRLAGYIDRRIKLDEKTCLELKMKIIKAAKEKCNVEIRGDEPLIWFQYIDAGGCFV